MEWQRIRTVGNGPFRFVRAAVPYLLAGVVSTVVLAWGLALTGSKPGTTTDTNLRDRRRFDGEGLGRVVVHRADRFGFVRFDAVVYPTCVAAASTDPRTPEEVVPGWASAAVLPWSSGRRPWPQAEGSASGNASTDTTHVEAAGWPLPAVWRPCPPAATGTVNGISLPCRPVWNGLALDSVLLAVAWWWAIRAPRFAVAALRAAHGRCAACGYDLAGLPPVAVGRVRCPECGLDCRQPVAPRVRPNLVPAA